MQSADDYIVHSPSEVVRSVSNNFPRQIYFGRGEERRAAKRETKMEDKIRQEKGTKRNEKTKYRKDKKEGKKQKQNKTVK